MSNLERRLTALEGGKMPPHHEAWLEAMDRASRGEAVDWSSLPKANPKLLQELQ